MDETHEELREIVREMRREHARLDGPGRESGEVETLTESERNAAIDQLGDRRPDLDARVVEEYVDEFVDRENLTRAGGARWRDLQDTLDENRKHHKIVGYEDAGDLSFRERALVKDAAIGSQRGWRELALAALFLTTGGVLWAVNSGDEPEQAEVTRVEQEEVAEPAEEDEAVVLEEPEDITADEIAAAVERDFPDELADLVSTLREGGLDDATIAAVLRSAGVADPEGDWFWSSSDQPAGNGGADVDVIHVLPLTATADEEATDILFNNTVFPCGQTSPDGAVTVCSRDAVQDMPAGEIAVVAQVLAAPAADEAPQWQYTYALVADTDGDPGNDFQYQPPYDFDLFRDTDTWWVVDNVDGLWSMGRFAASFDAPLPSAARVVIRGNAMVWFVPRSELPAQAGVRTTSFRHDGSFQPEMSGADVIGADPTDPLLPITDHDLTLRPTR